MNIESLREYCLSKSCSEETQPFGPEVLVYKEGGKIFLLLPLNEDTLTFSVKCDPEKAAELREEFACVMPGYHMNKKHWNTILVDGSVSANQLKEWIDHSYQLVVEKLSGNLRDSLLDI